MVPIHGINYLGIESVGVITYKNYKIELYLVKDYKRFHKHAVGWV